jgi:hypothetical protein
VNTISGINFWTTGIFMNLPVSSAFPPAKRPVATPSGKPVDDETAKMFTNFLPSLATMSPEESRASQSTASQFDLRATQEYADFEPSSSLLPSEDGRIFRRASTESTVAVTPLNQLKARATAAICVRPKRLPIGKSSVEWVSPYASVNLRHQLLRYVQSGEDGL